VGGVVTITGNARAGAQERWWLQVGQGGEPTQWTPITPEIGDHIDNGVLGTWDTTGLDGRWVIQLVVIDGGNPRTVSVPVDVDNQGPSVAITAPGNGQTYSISAGDKITVKVDAKDNIAIRRVELYLNGYHVATNTLAPYDLTVGLDALPGEIENPDALMAAVGPWAPPAPPEGGRALVAHAVAYDAANNLAFSGPVTIYVAP